MIPAEQPAIKAAFNETVAQREFPNETWINADNINLNHVEMPKNADGIVIAMSRLPINLQEELDFIKEIKSAIILKKLGASVTLVPRIKDPITGAFFAGPDAIVDGVLFEFKEITGGISKIGDRFKDSRKQGNNVYLRVANPNLSKRQVLSYFSRFINDPNYQGGYKGKIIFSFGSENRPYFFRIMDFKK